MIKGFPHKTICVDANFLVALLDLDSKWVSEETRSRISYFVAMLDIAKSVIVVPTPAVAEYLVKANQAGLLSLKKLQGRALVRICDFNLASAYECALLDGAAMNGQQDKKDGSDSSWQKIKIDRQIVAIARVNSCTAMISNDESVAANCNRLGIDIFRFDDLPLPPEPAQKELPLDKPKRKPRASSKTNTTKKDSDG